MFSQPGVPLVGDELAGEMSKGLPPGIATTKFPEGAGCTLDGVGLVCGAEDQFASGGVTSCPVAAFTTAPEGVVKYDAPDVVVDVLLVVAVACEPVGMIVCPPGAYVGSIAGVPLGVAGTTYVLWFVAPGATGVPADAVCPGTAGRLPDADFAGDPGLTGALLEVEYGRDGAGGAAYVVVE